MIGCLLALAIQAGATETNLSFDERVKLATGPAQLRELEAWCAKNKDAEGRKKVLAILTKAPPTAKGAGGVREHLRTQSDVARAAVEDFRSGRAKAVAGEIGKILDGMAADQHAPAELKGKLTALVKALLSDDPAEAKELSDRIGGLTHAEKSADETKKASEKID